MLILSNDHWQGHGSQSDCQPGPRRARNSSSRVNLNSLALRLAHMKSAGCLPQPLSRALTTVTNPDSMITRHCDNGMIQS
eukprot:249301-Rhodomonas_salina.1